MTFKIRTRRARVLAVGALVIVLGGVACEAASTHFTSAPSVLPPATSIAKSGVPVPAGAPVAAGGASAAVAAPAPADAVARSNAAPAAQSAPQGGTTVPDTSAQLLDRMVIRTAQLTIEVGSVEDALAKARDIATRAGGYVSASSTHVENANDQSSMVADLTLQVRSDSVDSTMSELRALGNVTTETSGSQDVTQEYVDLDSNLRNLQATEAAILKLMNQATQIQDILSLQRELTNVRGEIERIQGRMNYLNNRTDLATITLSLRPASSTPSSTTTTAWDPLAAASRGWQTSLALLRGAADVIIVALAFSWWLVPFVGVGAYLWLHRRPRPAAAAAPAETA